jgi:hypothetical protein
LSYPPPYHGHYRPQPPVSHGPYPHQPQSPAGYYPPQQQYQQYPPQPQPGYPAPYQYVQPVQQHMVVSAPATSGLAVTSLIFGLIGFFGGFCIFGIPCLIAVLAGHLAVGETRNGERGGHGMAIAGLILGYILLIPAIVVVAMGGVGAVFGSVNPTPTP